MNVLQIQVLFFILVADNINEFKCTSVYIEYISMFLNTLKYTFKNVNL